MNAVHVLKKKRLADDVRSGLIRKFGGLKAAFGILGLQSYDSLRQDLSQNRFSEEELMRICRGINLPSDIEKLREVYDFVLKKVRPSASPVPGVQGFASRHSDAFGVIDSRMGRMRDYLISPNETIPRFFESMGQNDLLVVFISDDFPTHWLGPEAASWAYKIRDAIARGGLMIYFCPSDQVFQLVQRNACTATILTRDTVTPAFEAFRRRLVSVGANEKSLHNLILCECDNPLVFTPEHRYGIYFRHREDKVDIIGTEVVPVRDDTVLDQPGSTYWVFLVGPKFTSFLQEVCETTLTRAIDNFPSRSSDPGEDTTSPTQHGSDDLKRVLQRCYFMSASSVGSGQSPAMEQSTPNRPS
jgi:hypothetical protein